MEAGAVLLLLFGLLATASTHSFHGDSIIFMPPQQRSDGTVEVVFHHRQNGRSNCHDMSSFKCESGVCLRFDKLRVAETDHDNTGQGRWCQSEALITATVSTNETSFSLSDSDCCWVSNINRKSNWKTHVELDLGTRSDTQNINSCPVSATVSTLRVPQNCFRRLPLLAYDPDGDDVKCRFPAQAIHRTNITLEEHDCTLTSKGEVEIGVHALEIILEDFPTSTLTMTYPDGTQAVRGTPRRVTSPFCTVMLQFTLEILPPISDCDPGHMLPIFWSVSPSHGSVQYVTLGQEFQLQVQAQAKHASINEFQISGPESMQKAFSTGEDGKAAVTLSWTPRPSELYRFVPVCFTAETNETQSEMRCIVLVVTQASITQGKAMVECSADSMLVVVEKASMPGIDENFLRLRDRSCNLTSNGTHIMGNVSFQSCGTKLEDNGDFIIFKNEIVSFQMPNEIIIRRRVFMIDFSCQFPKTVSISSYYNLPESDYIISQASFGSFGYNFDIYLNSSFTEVVEANAYPVEVMLMDKIYLGVKAQSELQNVKLFVESCKATPDNNPDNAVSYDLIKHGCIKDETIKLHTSDQMSFNFEFQAFKFSGNNEQVYIICSVILCNAESPFSRCALGCLKDPSRRRRRGLSEQTSSQYLIQGPLRFVEPVDPVEVMEERSISAVIEKNDTPVEVNPPPVPSDTRSSSGGWGIRILDSSISTGVLATLFLVSLVLMAVVIRHFTRKRKGEDHSSLIDSGSDN